MVFVKVGFMKEIKLFGVDANRAMEIVRELRQQGLKQGTDFDFSYNQTKYDNWTLIDDKHTVFKFYDDKYATLFALRYSA
jgi:hypothetical protein